MRLKPLLWIAGIAAAGGAWPFLPLAPVARAAPPKPAAAGAATKFPLTVTDDSGRRLTFSAAPSRIVCLSPAHTETLYALGAGPRVVAQDQYSDYPREAKPKATLNCFPRVPLEPLVALKPDLVVLMVQGPDEIRGMEGAGLRVLRLFPQTFAGAIRGIETLGQVTGSAARARQITMRMLAQKRGVEQKVRGAARKRVMYELDGATPQRPYVAGNGGFYGELLAMAGGQNIFSDEKGPSLQASLEQILARDPEVVLMGDTRSPVQPQSPQLLAARPGWGGLTAVKRRQVFPVNSDRITRPSPRLAEGLEEIARLLHPERFK